MRRIVRALDAPSEDDEAESGREARAASAQDFLLAMIEPADPAMITIIAGSMSEMRPSILRCTSAS